LISKNIYNNDLLNVITDKQDTISNIIDIVPRKITFNTIVGRDNSIITSDVIRAKDSLNFLKNNQYLNVSTELDSKQIKITENDYLTISDVSGLSAALENVTVGDILISDVSGLSTALDGKQTKITDNSYLSISDVSGLSTALENVTVGDLSISDVTNLQSTLDSKQDEITIYDDLIFNSLYLVPFTAKAQVSPSRNGEIQASYMTVTNTSNGSIDVGESIVSLTTSVNGKQDSIGTTSGLTLSTLTASGSVSCGDLTVGGKTITTIVDEASGSSLTKTDIDGKQDILEEGTNISINATTKVISTTPTINLNTLNVISELGVSTISDVPGEITCDSLKLGGTSINALIDSATSNKQEKLNPLDNINIDDSNNISLVGVATTNDLTSALTTKQNILTPGNSINIKTVGDLTTISATTVYMFHSVRTSYTSQTSGDINFNSVPINVGGRFSNKRFNVQVKGYYYFYISFNVTNTVLGEVRIY
jgi:SepF-like predicted cell division protein (DUF552 family)